MTDTEWLSLYEKDAEKAFEKLYSQYANIVYAIACNHLHSVCSSGDIEECVLTVFMEFSKNISSIDLNKGSIKAYLLVMSKRKAIDLYRKCVKNRNMLISLDDDNFIEPILDSKTMEEELQDREAKALLIDKLKSLGQRDCEILMRRYYLGQSTKEIAKALKLKNNTVDKKISRALQKLNGILGGNADEYQVI